MTLFPRRTLHVAGRPAAAEEGHATRKGQIASLGAGLRATTEPTVARVMMRGGPGGNMFGPVSYESIYSHAADGEAKITVKYPPCACASPWFQCRCFSEQVTYIGAGIDQTGVPCPEFLTAVVRANPGADYIVMGGPPHLEAKVKAIIAAGRSQVAA